MSEVLDAIFLALQFQTVILMVVGLVIGIVIGGIPGLNVPLAVAIALPITFYLEPLSGIAMLVGIYKGGTYGGSLSAVLINVPGTPAAAATGIDGHQLTRQGKAGKALKMSLYASGVGALLSDLALIFFAVPVAVLALRIGPAENFALGVFALTLIAVLSQGNMFKGLIAGTMGIFLATFGLDPLTGASRLTFGVSQLTAGWSFISLILGIFAIAEALEFVQKRFLGPSGSKGVKLGGENHRLTREDWRGSWRAIARSAPIGVLIGAVPGLGSAIAAFFSYGVARTMSKEPEKFGKGALEGVAAAESANNGVTSSTFIPLLTLGIPGDVITAIMLGAFMVHGLVPGPSLFTEHRGFIMAFFVMMLVTTILLVVIARLGMRLFLQTTRIPDSILFPVVVVLCFTGTYVATNNFFDLYATLGFGVLGFAMKKFNFPIAPLLIGFILGPLVEIALRQSLLLSRGSLDIFVTHPISLLFLLLALGTIAWVGWGEYRSGVARRSKVGA
ncbi:MAG: tripartite tricarboxylate transporter permease [Trueperaceae bacterium]